MVMNADGEFVFRPLSNIAPVTNVGERDAAPPDQAFIAPQPLVIDPLGPLGPLRGTWTGTGLNTIWRPLFDPAHPGRQHFLELNLTVERIDFTEIKGQIPNRGLLQGDLFMAGLQYLQQVSDNHGNGLHLEPGVWLTVPPTTDPQVPASVVRMGSIPHGTTILAQGQATGEPRAPSFAVADITPFVIGDPSQKRPFPESDLSVATPFRSDPALIAGITQAMVDDPNTVLQAALADQDVVWTTNLIITTGPKPIIGGGTANTAFLQGGRGRTQRRRGRCGGYLLDRAGAARRRVHIPPAAIHPDGAARLQRSELAARVGRDADAGRSRPLRWNVAR